MKLVISVDVEEEGLFSGRYPRQPPGVKNVAALQRLEFIPREFGLPLTLLLSYQVAINSEARPITRAVAGAARGRDRGAPASLEHATVFATNRARAFGQPGAGPGDGPGRTTDPGGNHRPEFCRRPPVFRMGRFDWWPSVLELLPKAGLVCDSSMVPLAHYVGRVDQFQTPPDPFGLEVGHPPRDPGGSPLHHGPGIPGTGQGVYRFARTQAQLRGEKLLATLRTFGAADPPGHVSAAFHAGWRPAYTGAERAGADMFFHSSELHPGATPHYQAGASDAHRQNSGLP